MASKLTVAKNLKGLRRRLGLTQKQFAEKVPGKVDCTYIGKIERGGPMAQLEAPEQDRWHLREEYQLFLPR